MTRYVVVLLGLLSGVTWAQSAQEVPELELVSEHPIEGMHSGNLSGMAWCGDALWAVSDRDDGRLYRLDARETVWQGEAERFNAPSAPDTGLPWGMRMRTAFMGLVRGGQMDFEGLSCDSLGNRYLASEAHAAVLRVSPAGVAEWLPLPDALVRQARASGMLLDFNAMLEGIAIDPAANRLWLAPERGRRGLLVMHRNQSTWQCTGGCVLLAEGGSELPPPALGDRPQPRRFSGLAFFNEKLFTLEPSTHQVCRRSLSSGKAERCWSYADTALADARRYDTPFGNAEALSLDEQGAWIGVDNNDQTRSDGEKRPIVWRFAAPKGGWSARQ